MTLGQWLKEQRGDDTTQEQAAQAAGVTLRTWQRWEGDQCEWTVKRIRKGAAALGMTEAEADSAFVELAMGGAS